MQERWIAGTGRRIQDSGKAVNNPEKKNNAVAGKTQNKVEGFPARSRINQIP